MLTYEDLFETDPSVSSVERCAPQEAASTVSWPCSLVGAGASLDWLVLVFCERKTLLAG